jgi:hypothetical protein
LLQKQMVGRSLRNIGWRSSHLSLWPCDYAKINVNELLLYQCVNVSKVSLKFLTDIAWHSTPLQELNIMFVTMLQIEIMHGHER